MDKTSEAVEYEGAYVMDPVPGLKKCIVSFDLTSLYPSIMRQWAIGKDKHISGSAHMDLMNGLIEVLQNEQNSNASRQILTDIQQKGGFGEYYIENDIPECMTEYLEKNKVTMTVNNQFFSIEGESVFAYLINKLFKERKENKKMSQDFKKMAKEVDEELTRRGYVDKK
jgi:DNA polymerase elongation subunit (family B)